MCSPFSVLRTGMVYSVPSLFGGIPLAKVNIISRIDEPRYFEHLQGLHSRRDIWILDPLCLVVQAFEVEDHTCCQR